ncbi:hypothetical protein ABZ330_16345 [Streptomyces sp. NPDC006172]|uniref:hypothetical protein n=1 Tax=Streptomyces sp. NPDC006172 TaxID=3154470 RepID=UPI0033FCC24A
MDGHDGESGPGIGDLAKDTAKNKVGVLVDRVGGRYLMRPVNGGREWEVEPRAVEHPTPSEALAERNRARNQLTAASALIKAGK